MSDPLTKQVETERQNLRSRLMNSVKDVTHSSHFFEPQITKLCSMCVYHSPNCLFIVY